MVEAMFWFWMTFDTPEGTAVFIQPAYELGVARLKALLAGSPSYFKQGLQLDAKMSDKVPKKNDRAAADRQGESDAAPQVSSLIALEGRNLALY